jgi:hypothetical protein
MYTDFILYDINSAKNQMAKEAAENYLHYIHGVNPFNMVFLSNMYDYGAENSVNEFYHSWFTNGSAKWDRVGESTYGPAPGFLTGGANPGYDWDGCCPSGCGSSSNNAKCYSEEISPPKGQPNQKSYKDFNTSWPLNSWSVTENSCGYQLPYIRLLAAFVPAVYDCAGVFNGTASYDVCGVCSGGTTGIVPVNNSENCIPTSVNQQKNPTPIVFPNPASSVLNIQFANQKDFTIELINSQGQNVLIINATGNTQLDISDYLPGSYVIVISNEENVWTEKFVKL